MLDEKAVEESDFLKLGEALRDPKFLEVMVKKCQLENKVRVIPDRETDEPYLVRYYLQNFRPFGRIVMHNVLRSDIDGLHDHPWGFQNYIIRGGYWETNQEGRFWRPAGYSATRASDYMHRLEIDPAKALDETWTLFMMGPKEKDWGFLNEGKEWVQWEKHLANRKKK